MEPLVRVTEAARAQLRATLEATGDPELALRAAAVRTAAGTIEYGMGLDEQRERDERIPIDEVVAVLVSPASRELVAGLWIDYVEVAPGDHRFVFYRPGDETPWATEAARRPTAPDGEQADQGGER